MASSFNQVVLLGNMTRDVEIKHLPSGTAVAEISLAVSDGHKDATGKWVEETSFFDVNLWARNAEIAAEYLGQGSPVQIAGRLKQETWEKEGQKRSKVVVVCERLVLLPTGRGDGKRGDSTSQSGKTVDEYPQTGDDGGERRHKAKSAPAEDIPF